MKSKKNLLILALVSLFLIFTTSCAVIQPHHRSKGVIIHSNPRGKSSQGHMKKQSGEKSAKPYAPGKMKKNKRK
jgi:hypothetical protein